MKVKVSESMRVVVFQRLRRLGVAMLAAWPLASASAEAQTYPSRPVRIVVPAAPGGALDVIARLLASKVGEIWKQRPYIENKPGANWIIGMEAVAKSPPDGYTLLFVASAALTVHPFVFPNMPLDPLHDLGLVMSATHTPFVLLINPSVPARTVPEFIEHVRANPGKLNHASNSTTTMLASELFKARAKLEYVDINYRGASQAIVATQSGSTQLCFVDLGSGMSAIEGKTLYPLGLTSPTRYDLIPDMPTVAEQGLPGYSAASMTLLLAPASVPTGIVGAVNAAFQRARQSPEVVKRLHAMGQAVSNESRAEAAEALQSEAEQWKRLIAERHIQFGR
jgi:tripartite-type tricarboxylate transporter receptor subunit TctC